MPNGLDLRPYAPPASLEGPPTIGFVARLCRDKGLDTLVDAFVRLKRRSEHGALRLVAAGATLASDRPGLAALRRRIRDAGLEDAVELRSNVSFEEKLDVLRRCTVFSVPATYGESFGLYLLEAWAMGLPVVQPAHAAFPELVEGTGGGLLCAPDDPASLADGLHALLVDRARARRLGESGRRAVAERYGSEHMARAVEREAAREVERAATMTAPSAVPR